MAEGRGLTAIGWDHPRCSRPMLAATAAWEARGGMPVRWTFRPLSAFNDQPLAEIADAADVLVIDHPMVPAAAASLVPLDGDGGPAARDLESVGPSLAAYRWAGRLWALPIDAACHVSAARPDLLAGAGLAVPGTWDEVLDLARRAPDAIAAALSPADAICAFLTIAASAGRPVAPDRPIPTEPADVLAELVAHVGPGCLARTPPQALAALLSGVAAYSPILFGYVTASRAARDRGQLVYADAPRFAGAASRGILGGAGLAVSARRGEAAAAVELVSFLASEAVQRDVLVPAGGQPPARAVWADARSDRLAGGFFSQTGRAIDAAFIRPLDPRWPSFQRAAGESLVDGLRRAAPPASLVDDLERLRRTTFGRLSVSENDR